MDYSKEAINEMEKKGLFDSSMDPAVLKLDDEERQKILARLQAEDTQQDIQDKIGDYRGSTLPKKDKPSFFKRIVNFFKRLFSSSSTKQSSVRNAKSIMHNFNPQVVDPRTEKISKDFAYYLYDIYNVVYQLKILFREVLQNKKEVNFSHQLFIIQFIEEILSTKSKRIREQFNPKNLLKFAQTPGNELEELHRKMDSYFKHIEYTDKINIDQYSLFFENLLFLNKFNFTEFFQLFNATFTPDLKFKPAFQDANLFSILPYVKELGALFRSVPYKPVPENIIFHFDHVLSETLEALSEAEGLSPKELAVEVNNQAEDTDLEEDALEEQEKYAPEEAAGKEKETEALSTQTNGDEQEDGAQREKIHFEIGDLSRKIERQPNPIYTNITINGEDIRKAIKRIQRLNRKRIFENLVIYITEDPNYNSKKLKFSHYFLSKYKELFREFIVLEYSEIQYQLLTKLIIEDVLNFFQIPDIAQLDWMEGYNNEMAEKMISKKLSPFEFTLPAAVIKTFLKNYLLPIVKPIEEIILVVGDFADKSKATSLHDVIYNLKHLIENIENFERKFIGEEGTAFHNLRIYLGAGYTDKGFHNLAQNKVWEIDELVFEILSTASNNMHQLGQFFDEILSDFKRHSPRMITNLKKLPGVKSKVFYDTISQNYDLIKNFNQMLDKMIAIPEDIDELSSVVQSELPEEEEDMVITDEGAEIEEEEEIEE